MANSLRFVFPTMCYPPLARDPQTFRVFLCRFGMLVEKFRPGRGDLSLDIDEVLDPEAQGLVARLRGVVGNEGVGRRRGRLPEHQRRATAREQGDQEQTAHGSRTGEQGIGNHLWEL